MKRIKSLLGLVLVLVVLICAAEGKRHLLIRDRDTTALRFNGYFTSIQID